MKTIAYVAGLLALAFATSSFAAGPPHYNGFSKTTTKKHDRVHATTKPLFGGCAKKAEKGTSKVSSKDPKRSNRNRKPYHKRMKGH